MGARGYLCCDSRLIVWERMDHDFSSDNKPTINELHANQNRTVTSTSMKSKPSGPEYAPAACSHDGWNFLQACHVVLFWGGYGANREMVSWLKPRIFAMSGGYLTSQVSSKHTIPRQKPKTHAPSTTTRGSGGRGAGPPWPASAGPAPKGTPPTVIQWPTEGCWRV